LAANYTNNLEISDCVCPIFIAGLVGLPAGGPDSLEKRGQVSNGEEDVTTRKFVSFSCN
jgi:hypothetical protein